MSKQEELPKTAFGVGVGFSVFLFGLVFLWTRGGPDFQEENNSQIRDGGEVSLSIPKGTPGKILPNRFQVAVE